MPIVRVQLLTHPISFNPSEPLVGLNPTVTVVQAAKQLGTGPKPPRFPPRALSLYRTLLKTQLRVFGEDFDMIIQAYNVTRQEFEKSRAITEPSKVQELLSMPRCMLNLLLLMPLLNPFSPWKMHRVFHL